MNDSAIEQVGNYLKRQRELRGVSLPEVSKETKIAVHWLEAMESDSWGNLPGRPFARNFVKSYAKAIGLHEEEVVLMFDSQLEAPPVEIPAVTVSKKIKNKKIVLLSATLFAIAVVTALIFLL